MLVRVSDYFWPKIDKGDEMLDYMAWVRWQFKIILEFWVRTALR
jgi:hypothetical protein